MVTVDNTNNNNEPQRLKLKLTCSAQTHQTGIILPAGTVGKVLDYQKGDKCAFWVVDFGLVNVITLPINSPLVEILR